MSEKKPWTPADIPDLSGKRALVTGVTSGIGESTVIELARHGAQVILGARNPAKLEASIRAIEKEVPGASLEPLSIDVHVAVNVGEPPGQHVRRQSLQHIMTDSQHHPTVPIVVQACLGRLQRLQRPRDPPRRQKRKSRAGHGPLQLHQSGNR